MSTCSLTITSGSNVRGETRIVSWVTQSGFKCALHIAKEGLPIGCRVMGTWRKRRHIPLLSARFCSRGCLQCMERRGASSVVGASKVSLLKRRAGLLPLQGAQQYESAATGKILERKWHPFGKDRTPAGLATWLAVAPRVPWLATKVLHLAPGFHETTSEVAPFFPTPSRMEMFGAAR